MRLKFGAYRVMLTCAQPNSTRKKAKEMFPFTRLKWAEMRPLVHDLIGRMHDGHARKTFSLPVVEFVSAFAPGADAGDLERTASRGSIEFTADAERGGAFRLPAGEPASFALGRENLSLRIPERMSGRYELYDGGFLVAFDDEEELEGCKRVLVNVCNRLESVNVSTERVYIRAVKSRMFDLLVEF